MCKILTRHYTLFSAVGRRTVATIILSTKIRGQRCVFVVVKIEAEVKMRSREAAAGAEVGFSFLKQLRGKYVKYIYRESF